VNIKKDEWSPDKVQIRVVRVLKEWVKSNLSGYDFDEDKELVVKVSKFVTKIAENKQMLFQVAEIKKILEDKIANDNRPLLAQFGLQHRTISERSTAKARTTIDGDAVAKVSIVNYSPNVIAAIVTQEDFDYFRMIHPREFLRQAWTKANKEEIAPNLTFIIKHFNSTSNWVAYEVLLGQKAKDRMQIVGHFLQVAKVLFDMKNFFGMGAIMSALTISPISRLKRTFQKLSVRMLTLLDEYSSYITGTSNFKAMRTIMSHVTPPAIPLLSISLKDLTFVEDGNPDFLSSGGINFYKWYKVSEVIHNVFQYQETPFSVPLSEDELLRYYIQKNKMVAIGLGENGLFQLSKKCEPQV